MVKRLTLAALEKQVQFRKKSEFYPKLKNLNLFIEAKVQDIVERHELKKKPKFSTSNNAIPVDVNTFERFRQLDVKDNDEQRELKDPPTESS